MAEATMKAFQLDVCQVVEGQCLLWLAEEHPWVPPFADYRDFEGALNHLVGQVIEFDAHAVHIREAPKEGSIRGHYMKNDRAKRSCHRRRA